jgi:magnesium-transporting ATPase (P-type)
MQEFWFGLITGDNFRYLYIGLVGWYNSNKEATKMQTLNAEQLEKIDDQIEMIRHQIDEDSSRAAWTHTAISTLLGALLSLVIGAASASSWISSIHIRNRQVWFLLGVLGFQSILFLIIWMIRKRNLKVIKVKDDLIRIYLSAINKSSLNPNF